MFPQKSKAVEVCDQFRHSEFYLLPQRLPKKNFNPTFQEQNSRYLSLNFDKSNKHNSTLCPYVVIPKKQPGKLLIKTTKCRYLGVAAWMKLSPCSATVRGNKAKKQLK